MFRDKNKVEKTVERTGPMTIEQLRCDVNVLGEEYKLRKAMADYLVEGVASVLELTKLLENTFVSDDSTMKYDAYKANLFNIGKLYSLLFDQKNVVNFDVIRFNCEVDELRKNIENYIKKQELVLEKEPESVDKPKKKK